MGEDLRVWVADGDQEIFFIPFRRVVAASVPTGGTLLRIHLEGGHTLSMEMRTNTEAVRAARKLTQGVVECLS